MMIYIVLGRKPYYGEKVSVLGVYRDKLIAKKIYDDYFLWRDYMDMDIVEEWMD